MNRALLLIIGSLAAVGISIGLLMYSADDRQSVSGEPLTLYCAASNRSVIEEILEAYRKETGREVVCNYGPSQTLLSQLEVSETGDLYLPADDSYIEMGRESGLLNESIPIAKMQAVLVVAEGNPKGITSFDDLLRDDVTVVLANPDAAAIGKMVRAELKRSGKWEVLQSIDSAEVTTVTDVANQVKVGAANAGIVYDAVLHDYPELDYVEIPELAPVNSPIAVSVIDRTKRSAEALHLARFITSKDRGLKIYEDHGFQVARGDVWEEVPELVVFAGSMLRPAIEETIAQFQEREGCRITTSFNGCGILVGQMNSGARPDVYFACDEEFMNQVTEFFPESINVSQNELIILVQKGNPHEIATLKDLSKPGLKVGIGHEKQCAMGWLTQNTLKEDGVQEVVMENVTVQTPTGDMLVNQMLTGSLDAAVVYLSNAAGSGDKLDAVRIQGLECAIATQPFGIRDESEHQQLAIRLLKLISSKDSKETFEANGFGWQLEE